MEAVVRADDLPKPPETLGSNSTVNKENENVHNAAAPIPVDATPPNAGTERSQAAPEAQNTSIKVPHDSQDAVAPDSSNPKVRGTEPVADISTKGQTPNTEVGARNTLPTDHQHKQRPRVSHTLSFPAKGILTSGTRKSTSDIKVTNTAAPKTSRSNGPDPGPGNSAKQSKLSSATATRHHKIVNNGGHSSSMPRSTTCVVTSTPVFASRLDERAEKRKEFFLKLEEKIHAIEMEKTDQQAKSKEDQEAEIKKLRKSLTFKATPMPSFYKEPGPPKTELKKQIPTTRPISPKLGRHKPSAITTDAPPHGNSLRSDVDASKTNGDATHVGRESVDRKKPLRKSLSKSPSLKSTSSKIERKIPGTKAEATDTGETDACAGANADEKDQSKVDLAAQVATPIEVSIGG